MNFDALLIGVVLRIVDLDWGATLETRIHYRVLVHFRVWDARLKVGFLEKFDSFGVKFHNASFKTLLLETLPRFSHRADRSFASAEMGTTNVALLKAVKTAVN